MTFCLKGLRFGEQPVTGEFNGGRIDVEARRQGDMAVVTVTDTGIGIPSDKLGDIFELFSTAHQGSEAGSQGLGLGLNLAFNIVEAHDGELVAESAGEAKGARFSVCLPIADSPAGKEGPG